MHWQILNHDPQKTLTMQFSLIQADQPLSNLPICVIPLSVPDLRHAFSLPSLVIYDVFTTLVLVLFPVILCSQTGLRHAVCGPPGLATTTASKKNNAQGFLWDKDCQCQLQYDKCQCMKTDMSTDGRGDLFQMSHVIRVLCHPPNNMSKTKKSLHPRIMLYRVKIIINIILFKAKWRIEGIYEHSCKNIPSDAFKSSHV